MRIKPEHEYKPGIGDQCKVCGMSFAYHIIENKESKPIDIPEKRLATIRFTRPMYESFKRELEKNNTYISRSRLSELLTIDVGFGPIELVVED